MKETKKATIQILYQRLDDEESDKEFSFSEDFDDKHIKNKDSSLGSMFVEWIESLIANATKA